MALVRSVLLTAIISVASASLLAATPDTHPAAPSPTDGAIPDESTAASPEATGVDEEQIAFAPEGELLLRLSFSDDQQDLTRVDLDRLNAEITLDAWDRATHQPLGLTGWLTGRANGWGKSDHSREEIVADMLNDMGCTLPIGITAGLLASDSSSENRAGRQARDAILATSAATHLLKFVIDSPRPVNPDNLEGFPSGHTSMSVAFARAISEEHRDWGAAAYLWAGGVAWSRVRRGDHTPEQVVAGALLGWFIADALADSGRPEIRMPRDGGPMIPAGRASW
jgi:hypothetical protein